MSGTAAGGIGGLAHEASNAAMAIIDALRHDDIGGVTSSFVFREKIMALLLLEALGALLLLVFIVWWTMFSGRQKGELKDPSKPGERDTTEDKK